MAGLLARINSIQILGMWVLYFLLTGFFGLTPSLAHDFNPQGWTTPNLYGAERYSDEMIIWEKRTPNIKVRLERFYTTDKGRAYRYSHNGNVFSYMVDHDRNDPMDYEIVDMNGTGAFEIKHSPYTPYPLPIWVLNPYLNPDDYGDKGLASARKPSSADMISGLKSKSMLVDGQAGLSKIILRLQFHYDSDVLTTQAKETLDQLGPALATKELSGSRFRIEGHTDAYGSAEYNLNLSQRRAKSVITYLHEKFNLDLGRLEAVGKGKTEPIDRANPYNGINRRVEVVNLGPATPVTPAGTK